MADKQGTKGFSKAARHSLGKTQLQKLLQACLHGVTAGMCM